MVVGFNHNFRYQGEVYHIQTEDSGMKNPNIVTLLYHGGTILASKKTSYADICKIDNLEHVVEELMKEQHKNMLRSLKSGKFDLVIERHLACGTGASGKTGEHRALAGKDLNKARSADTPIATAPIASTEIKKAPLTKVRPRDKRLTTAPVVAKPATAAAKRPASPVVETSLDEVILSYLLGDD